MLKQINITSRKSDLARLQTLQVAAALKKLDPQLNLQLKFRATLGDLDTTTPLNRMESKGVFTSDFREDLLQGNVDIVVHSWKDLPTEVDCENILPDQKPSTLVAATLPRADTRDVLLVQPQWKEGAKTHLRILTSSPRRVHHLQSFLPQMLPQGSDPVQLEFLPVRGNIQTRLQKLQRGEGDALVVAKAALDRLTQAPHEWEEFQTSQNLVLSILQKYNWMILPLSRFPTAAAQGAIAIEVLSTRQELKEMLNKINCHKTWFQVQQERRHLARLGGGCHQKIGITVSQYDFGSILNLKGLTDSGMILDTQEFTPIEGPEGNEGSEGKINNYNFPLASSDECIFPNRLEDNLWFKRTPMAPSAQSDLKFFLKNNSFFWVSRLESWPDEFTKWISKEPTLHPKVVWTAGISTWKKLAQRGIWVNGCADGLGTVIGPQVDHWYNQALQFAYLTHDEAPEFENTKLTPVISTYKLSQLTQLPCLDQKTHFFWTSGSTFLAAWTKNQAQLKKGYHFCGPGRTQEIITRVLQQPPRIFLNWEHWRKSIVKK
ncbi:MAG: hydroxymethylbilane synthase [Bdellovibrionales bacterium]|nr:hydroxymethylbilane synthase [Bdellovibrionales bacterium]